jgi:hypothetical protein
MKCKGYILPAARGAERGFFGPGHYYLPLMVRNDVIFNSSIIRNIPLSCHKDVYDQIALFD